MERGAELFKDDILRGISLAIKNLQHQQAETQVNSQDAAYQITKYNPHFRNLINFLDLVFCFGLKDGQKSYWQFVKKVSHSSVAEIVEKHNLANNDIKKGYIWLFLTFVEDSLESYVRMMVLEKKLLKYFYTDLSFLRDDERLEILFNLLAGMETLNFSLNFEEPYMDYGHDPVLRQEKIIIRLDPKSHLGSLQQPDITILPKEKQQRHNFPDLLKDNFVESRASSTPFPPEARRSPFRNSLSMCEIDSNCEEEIAYSQKKYSRKKKKRTASESDKMVHHHDEEDTLEKSIELEEDNFIPEILGSPEYKVYIPEEPATILQTSDPMIRQFSGGDTDYNAFLETYKTVDTTVANSFDENITETNKLQVNVEDEDANPKSIGEELEESLEDSETKLKSLTIQETEGYRFTYVSENEQDEDENFDFQRADSYDRFCRRGSVEDATVETGQLAEQDVADAPTLVPPEVTAESLFRIQSPLSTSISRSSIEKLNVARLNTRSGLLFPTLPRRPDLDEAMKMMDEIILDQNTRLIMSLDLFHDPAETVKQVFKVFVGRLSAIQCPMYLLVSNLYIYLLKKRETTQSGFVKVFSMKTDDINKVQTSLNYQDIFMFHDQGCFHVSTGDEIVTRSVISTIRSTIKPNQEIDEQKTQPMAENTYNELDLVIQDWLICHSGDEEPNICHFALVDFAILSTNEEEKRVMKSGILQFQQLPFSLVNRWETGYFVLRGATLHRSSVKHQEDVKQTYDLSNESGGCVRADSRDGLHIFHILKEDGSAPLLELAVEDEEEANNWLLNICQVVADAKNGVEVDDDSILDAVPCGIVLTMEKLYLFTQEPKSGRLTLENSCCLQYLTQVCVDDQQRCCCTLSIERHDEDKRYSSKTLWFIHFQSEFELGKFEKKLFDKWQSLYQVPLQFVLLGDESLKRLIQQVISNITSGKNELGKEEIKSLIKL